MTAPCRKTGRSVPSMNFSGFLRAIFATMAILALGRLAEAHPIPDLPVRGVFETGGACTVYVEVNPRCFDDDPANAPSLTKEIYETLSPARKAELIRLAEKLTRESLEFYFEPAGRVQPEWVCDFTGEGHRPLINDDDIVVLMGSWKTTIHPGVTGWRIRALPGKRLAVFFQNFVDGVMHPRTAMVFPGETSYTLDLAGLAGTASSVSASGAVPLHGSSDDWRASFGSFVKLGFVHVLPEGFDHILFVVGLYLLSRSVRPLLWQITTFTLAHSVTLALATLGYVHVSRSFVEPVIALSIAAVALENIFHPRYTPWRLLVIFTFGLVHGLGFASGLGPNLPKASIAVGLVGFNVGVECAQIAVIVLCLFLTGWIRDAARYRQWIVVPGSALIAAIGLWWATQRVAAALFPHQQPRAAALSPIGRRSVS